jgi:hypothetical protein
MLKRCSVLPQSRAGEGFRLSRVDRQPVCSVHSPEGEQATIRIDDRGRYRHAQLARLSLGGADHPLGDFMS